MCVIRIFLPCLFLYQKKSECKIHAERPSTLLRSYSEQHHKKYGMIYFHVCVTTAFTGFCWVYKTYLSTCQLCRLLIFLKPKLHSPWLLHCHHNFPSAKLCLALYLCKHVFFRFCFYLIFFILCFPEAVWRDRVMALDLEHVDTWCRTVKHINIWCSTVLFFLNRHDCST